MRIRLLAPLALLALALAGCQAAPSEDDGDGAGEETLAPLPSDSSSTSEAPAPYLSGQFGVLVVDGSLRGSGPAPESHVACAIAAADGAIDLEAREAWARPGQHTFESGETWMLVLDRVAIEDPRGGASRCRVPALLTPFIGEAHWAPQMNEPAFRLNIGVSGEDLLISKAPLAEGEPYGTHVEFEDGQYTFTGNLTFTHAGWWPPSAFTERDGPIPDDGKAAWWQ